MPRDALPRCSVIWEWAMNRQPEDNLEKLLRENAPVTPVPGGDHEDRLVRAIAKGDSAALSVSRLVSPWRLTIAAAAMLLIGIYAYWLTDERAA